MSGIVGLFDAAGVDVGLVERAAAAGSPHRGRAVVRTVGRWTIGTLANEREDAAVVGDGGGFSVADARVDAALPGSEAAGIVGSVPGPVALARLLGWRGPAGLAGVVGDFAVAHVEDASGVLTLVRDAFGLRPLYWARRTDRAGFASDVETLIAMGLVDGSVDVDAVRRLLFEQGEYGDRSLYAGVRRVLPGRWVQLRPDGSASGGRWFRPELVRPDPDMTLARAGELTREAIISSVADRAAGKRVALLLSAGRDSSAVAVALADAGIKATCLTYSHDVRGMYSEAVQARDLARSLGHEWHEVPVSPGVDPSRGEELGELVGRPVRGVAGPMQLRLYDAIRAYEPDVVMSGEGGDLLFSAFPIGILDLARRGKLRRAVATARAFDREWAYRYPVVGKVLVRGLAPRWLLSARERKRPRPPWLFPPSDVRVRTDRSDESYLRTLMVQGPDITEVPDRLFSKAGAQSVWPLVDLRVVDVALRLPVELRLPYPAPKQVLDEALLGARGRGLVKASLDGYIEPLLPNLRADFPQAFEASSLAVRAGLIRAEGLVAARDARWRWEAIDLAGLDMWLRWLEERDGT